MVIMEIIMKLFLNQEKNENGSTHSGTLATLTYEQRYLAKKAIILQTH